MDLSDLMDIEFKIVVIKVLPNLGRRKGEHSENFNKEIELFTRLPNGSHRADEYNN